MTDTATEVVYDTAGVHRRTLRVLWVSAVFSRGAVSAIFPVSVLAIKDLLGSETFAGLSTGASTVGSAVSAVVLAAYMQRRGRNPGLTAGLGAAVLGALLGIAAIQLEFLPLFLVGMVLVGVGSGTSNLSRYAAADLASADRRSRDISSVIFAATFGAVLFPLFLGVAGDIAVELGLDENAGGFAMGAGFFLISSAAIWIFMRPDPLVVAGGSTNAPRGEGRSGSLPRSRRDCVGAPARQVGVCDPGRCAGRDGHGDGDDAPAHEGARPWHRRCRTGDFCPHRWHVCLCAARRLAL